MASDLATTGLETDVGGSALSAARVRVVLTFVATLLVILVLGAVLWLRVAAHFDTARVRTGGEIMRAAMSGMLSMGLPLEDFIGFQAVATRVFQTNPGIRAIVVRERDGRTALSTPLAEREVDWQPPVFPSSIESDAVIVDQVDGYARITLPVFNRFGPAGSLELLYQPNPLRDLTRSAALAGLVAMILLAAGLAVHGLAIANPEFFLSRRDLVTAYALVSALGLALTSSTLLGLAAEKAEETAGAYAYSLGTRLGEAVAVGISPDQLSGLDEVVAEYRGSNDVIGYVALLEGNRIAAATGLGTIGQRWEHPDGYFDALYEVRPRRLYTPQYRVAVGIHWTVAVVELARAAMVPSAVALPLLLAGAFAVTRMRAQDRA